VPPSDKEISDAFLRRISTCLERPFKATAPVLQATTSGGLGFVGSAVLLDAGEHAFALTASHVLDEESSGELLLGRMGHAVSLRGPRALTRIPPGGSRQDDQVDLAMVHLTEAVRSSFAPDEFIKPSDLYLDRPPTGNFILTGYPLSHQPRRLAPGDDAVRMYTLVADEIPVSHYGRDGYNRAVSLLLGFNKKRTWRLETGQATAPDLKGASGGGVWHLQDLSASSLTPRLCAIVIEWHRQTKRILATRVRVAIEELAQRFPELGFPLAAE
jgi:hypothetical protein